jgi:hypothetical protein
MASLELGSYMCNYLWVASFAEGLYVEQIEADIASSRDALANASPGIDKVCKVLKSLGPRTRLRKARCVIYRVLTRGTTTHSTGRI